ncbi:unnamed protein product [Vitrella brassicaformis CCMP3155]|uniref:Uncharacterized protein n=2 Tax=Vitrella brassicaformis TaxID=1169539 RepID=A0A0G4ED28_VITBC|nr:unnamed protein product [Vitrella brassicaformis CCMP3155]|mmetsp:Transcript_24604/g.60829  ORF Transcript_24604/g.60829 Transcript_24604/m.60829 type:complete len:133 (+) Transcript_24604:156-554(+)|eukprot:CEL93900.1 unnamed protein product [Vitrella brassicaformis CCMP3155]
MGVDADKAADIVANYDTETGLRAALSRELPEPPSRDLVSLLVAIFEGASAEEALKLPWLAPSAPFLAAPAAAAGMHAPHPTAAGAHFVLPPPPHRPLMPPPLLPPAPLMVPRMLPVMLQPPPPYHPPPILAR